MFMGEVGVSSMWHRAYVRSKDKCVGSGLSFYLCMDAGEQFRLPELWGKYFILWTISAAFCVCMVCACLFVASLCIPDWPWICSNIPDSTFPVLKLGAFSLTSWGNGKGTTDFKGFKLRTMGAMVVLSTFWSQFHQEGRVIAEWVSNPFFLLPVSFHPDLLTPDALMQAHWHHLRKHTSSFTSAFPLLCWLQNDFTSHVRWYS